MDLWIRSQDKMALSKYDLLIVEETPTGEYMFIADHYKNFGTYKTKERAVEVLDEIQEILKPKMILTKMGEFLGGTCDGTVYSKPNEYDIKELSTYVYEMPID